MSLDFASQVGLGLTEGRQLAEALMVDTCTVSTWTGRTVQNETDGEEAKVYAVDFTSKCKVQQRAANQVASPEVGGRRVAIDEVEIHLPVSAEQVVEGQVIEITAVGALSDVRMLGRKFVVSSPMNKTHATATRLQVKELP
jgi:hypothetical protein